FTFDYLTLDAFDSFVTFVAFFVGLFLVIVLVLNGHPILVVFGEIEDDRIRGAGHVDIGENQPVLATDERTGARRKRGHNDGALRLSPRSTWPTGPHWATGPHW